MSREVTKNHRTVLAAAVIAEAIALVLAIQGCGDKEAVLDLWGVAEECGVSFDPLIGAVIAFRSAKEESA